MEATNAAINCYLPHEITENILSRLPLKYLLRFKCVCKKWNSTISDDPEFAQTHLLQSQISNGSTWLVEHATLSRGRAETLSRGRAQVLKLEDDEFRVVSIFDHPLRGRTQWHCECHCDGLYVMSACCDDMYGMEFALWNPSRRWYSRLNPSEIFGRVSDTMIAGICYDKSSKDYKVVFGNNNLYLVFSCKSNSWSGLREMDVFSFHFHGNTFNRFVFLTLRAVSFDGSVYWLFYSKKDSVFEIVCFDGKDEKFKKVKEVKVNEVGQSAFLVSSAEGLYLFIYHGYDDYEIIFMKKIKKQQEEEWMEVKVELPGNFGRVEPIGCTRGNVIILERFSLYIDYNPYLLYDVTKPSSPLKIIWGRNLHNYSHFFPYAENLFSLQELDIFY